MATDAFSTVPSRMLGEIAQTYGTPVYIYDGEILQQRCAEVSYAFSRYNPHFSLKANPNPGICKIISSLGFGAEVSSEFEARIALDSGFIGSSIMYDGPAKTIDEIAHALENGILHFNFESITELNRILKVASERGIEKDLRLCARINPLEKTAANEIMTGGSSRFGIDEEMLIPKLKKYSRYHRRINGVHLYRGSQILNSNELIINFQHGLDILEQLVRHQLLREDVPVDYVFGAGIGVPYSDSELPVDFELVAKKMSECLAKSRIDKKRINIRMEVGRVLVAQSGMYLVRVVDVKISRGHRYIIVDGGIHHFMRFALTRTNHRIRVLGKNAGRTSPASIVGATCTPYDVLAECLLGNVDEGDFLCVLDSGAYGWSMGMSHFLSRATPPEVAIKNNAHHLLRRRSVYRDIANLSSD